MSDSGGKDKEGTALGRWAANAKPLFWVMLVPVLPALVAAHFAGGGSPTYALESDWVYRLEVALAFYFGLFIFFLTLYLAYYGHTFKRMELPGGPAVETPDPATLDSAAEGFEEFKDETEAVLAQHEEALDDLDDRLAVFENEGETGLWARVRRVLSGT
jgi:hypothetical protein